MKTCMIGSVPFSDKGTCYKLHMRYSKAFVSFGELLLYMEGPYKKLTPLRIDYVYLLIKK